MLVGTIGVLALDFQKLIEADDATVAPFPSTHIVLPPSVETNNPVSPGDTRPFLPADEAAAHGPMRFTLEKGGILKAQGAIDPGAAERLAAELEQRGEYVKTVALDSPGGSLSDALAMSSEIRRRKLDTSVADGSTCASSCPLVLSGGVQRSAGKDASIGVHQFYAVDSGSSRPLRISPAQAMADAQATTATISRHLNEMGVDPAMWLHALDTPPRALYRFSPEELVEYRLVTGAVPVAGSSDASPP